MSQSTIKSEGRPMFGVELAVSKNAEPFLILLRGVGKR